MRRPERFGKYLILERISVGGMAEVLKARAFGVQGFARLVAIKKILPHLAEDPRFVEMFITEAKTAVQLNHANIAQIYELGREGDDHYIAMEYVAGKDLLSLHHAARRSGTRMPVDLIAHVGGRVAEGLDYAHRKRAADGSPLGIVHRDVSPQNVLVSYDGAVKLIDFGIAKARVRSFESTQGGALKGKFGYMAPEQIVTGDVDHRSDIFALGTVIHELLTGQRLFIADNDFATLERVREARVAPPSATNPEVPAALDDIVLKALARNPADRYATAGEMAEALARFLHTTGRGLSGKALSDWMKSRFADDIAAEKARDEAQLRWLLTPNGEVIEVDSGEDEETALWEPVFSEEEGPAPVRWPEIETAPDPLRALEAPSVPGAAVLPLPARPADLSAAPTPLPFRPRPSRRRHVLAIGAAVLGFAAGGAFALYRFAAEGAAEPGGLVVRVTPVDDAVIQLDGAPVSNRSPLVRQDLAAGDYAVEVEAPGFRPWSRSVTVEAGRLTEVTVRLEPVADAEARLRFETRPADAELTVDGRPYPPSRRGEMHAFTPGRPIEVVVSHNGYAPHRETVVPEAGSTRTLRYALKPTGGTLFVDSLPPADVYLDGRRVGRTPHTESNLDIGHPWRLRLTARGHEPLERTVRFGEQRFIQVEEKLKPR